jgi:hypothetical protein
MLPLFQASAGILHSDWIILTFIVALPLSALGILRFLRSWKKADGVDILILGFAGLFSLIVAVTSQQQDFINSTGQILTYQGEFWWLYILYPIGLIDVLLTIAASVVVMGSIARARRRGY